MIKYKLSKKAIEEYYNKMDEIKKFCHIKNIEYSFKMDSYYFTLNDKNYRVSNHTQEMSNSKSVNFLGEKVRENYHSLNDEIICIFAGKTRIIEIYNSLI